MIFVFMHLQVLVGQRPNTTHNWCDR